MNGARVARGPFDFIEIDDQLERVCADSQQFHMSLNICVQIGCERGWGDAGRGL